MIRIRFFGPGIITQRFFGRTVLNKSSLVRSRARSLAFHLYQANERPVRSLAPSSPASRESERPTDVAFILNQWDECKSRDSAKDNEAEAEVDIEVELTEGRDKSQGCDETGDVEGVAQVPKASDSALADATDVD